MERVVLSFFFFLKSELCCAWRNCPRVSRLWCLQSLSTEWEFIQFSTWEQRQGCHLVAALILIVWLLTLKMCISWENKSLQGKKKLLPQTFQNKNNRPLCIFRFFCLSSVLMLDKFTCTVLLKVPQTKSTLHQHFFFFFC